MARRCFVVASVAEFDVDGSWYGTAAMLVWKADIMAMPVIKAHDIATDSC